MKDRIVKEIMQEEYRKLELSDEERDIIEKYMDAMYENDIAYGHCAYKIGFLDCLVILKPVSYTHLTLPTT